MRVLVITKSTDHEGVQCTLDAIARQGGRAVRFDTDRFPTELGLDFGCAGGKSRAILSTEAGEFDLLEMDAVYYRRVHHGGLLPQNMDPQLRKAAQLESRAAVEGAITALRAFQLDPLWRIRRAEHKPLQLRIAQQLGLQIPRTLLSNRPEAVRRFAEQCPTGVVTQLQTSWADDDGGVEKVVYTSPVDAEALADLDGLSLCPMVFQERIEKKRELRATVVGTRLFASAIDSQQSPRASSDWRRDGLALIDSWYPYRLPDAVRRQLLQLMDVLGLQYGAIDLILTPDDRYVFLEVNPAGEYHWLDRQHNERISDALASVLLGSHRRMHTAQTLQP